MTILLSNVSKSYGIHNIFEDLTLQIVPKSRIGLIGRNGCGKSTLLKLIMGELDPDQGAITKPVGFQVNYLSQEPKITPGKTLYAEMQSVFSELNALMAEEQSIYTQLADETTDHMALADRLDTVLRELTRMDAGNIDAKIGRILKGIGFSQEDHQRMTEEFSGGWQMRINLAKILLGGADILLLDEPTNHLDLEACEWLENFLIEYPGGLVIVSHDRHFLDRVTTDIAELELKKMRVWPGNYTQHLQQKEEEINQQTSAYERQKKELSKQMAFVDRFRASATRSTQAKSREKQLDKIERVELPQHDNRKVSFRFPPPKPSGTQILTLQNVGKSFEDKTLFKNLNAELLRQQRVFLLGANGCGKTTLLRLILGLESLDATTDTTKPGKIQRGHNVELGYFSQHQLETLDSKLTVFDTLQQACPRFTNTELRTLLGRFLFSGDQVFKAVGTLSGGEKSKVALAKLMVSGPNTLLLDEPTNHIDIQTKDVMTEALQDYEGSILCISHDRYFIQALATEIWELYNGQLLTYCGDYEYYLAKRGEMRAQHDKKKPAVINKSALKTERAATPVSQFKDQKDLDRQSKKLEKDIMTLEKDIAALEKKLSEPSLQQNYQQLQEISAQISKKQEALHKLNEQWAILAESVS